MSEVPQPAQHDVTRMLQEWSAGDGRAADRLVPLLYEQLREIAHRHLRKESSGHTVNTTALVHEAYLGMVDQTRASWNDRAHFLAASSRAMRHILIDYARRRKSQKRGGDQIRVPLHDGMASVAAEGLDLLALDEALDALAERDEQMARLVECRFFGGMNVEETAEALGISSRSVKRIWARARVHLYKALDETGFDTPQPNE